MCRNPIPYAWNPGHKKKKKKSVVVTHVVTGTIRIADGGPW